MGLLSVNHRLVAATRDLSIVEPEGSVPEDKDRALGLANDMDEVVLMTAGDGSFSIAGRKDNRAEAEFHAYAPQDVEMLAQIAWGARKALEARYGRGVWESSDLEPADRELRDLLVEFETMP